MPIRVLQLCAVDFTVRQFIAPVARALEAAGYDVQCACTRGPHWAELEAMGLRMVDLSIARSANPLKAAAAVWRLVKYLRAERPHVLHVHTPVASMIGRLAGWLAGVPTIIYTAHGFYFHDGMPEAKRRRHIALERLFGRFNRYLFCVSSEDAKAAFTLGIARKDRIAHVPNGVDHLRFDPDRVGAEPRAKIRAEFGIPADAKVVAIMGRLVREKGYLEFFAAAQALAPNHPEAHFLVIGDTVTSEHDNAKADIVAAANHEALAGRVTFAGMRSDIPELLAASDIFCLPSHREGMPVSILEAMMMGLPVVATNIRGSREEVEGGKTGFLVGVGDARSLATAIGQLLADPEIAARMGAAGRTRALSEFRADLALQRQVDLYRTLVGPPR